MEAMQRREFFALIAGGAVLRPFFAEAQQAAKPPRIGFLASDMAGDPTNREGFLRGLRDLGYIEGRSIVIEYRDAQGKLERLPALAGELVALNVDVIVTGGGTLGALAAKQATTTLPIVFGPVGNPVEDGVVSNLARPGGNVTGFSVVTTDITGKLLQLLKEVAPGASRVGFLIKPDSVPERAMKRILNDADAAAQALGVMLQVFEARGPEDFERVFSDMAVAKVDALAVLVTSAFYKDPHHLTGLAAKNRLPMVVSDKTFVAAGGLMSYGPSFPDVFRRAATYVDKILKGANPGDLPVEQPTKFELVINLTTAKALGLTMPHSLLARADALID
jgi:putative tryptophan/tyrosine transport system substrate-binding protein